MVAFSLSRGISEMSRGDLASWATAGEPPGRARDESLARGDGQEGRAVALGALFDAPRASHAW